MASEYAKQIATLVAEALQDGPAVKAQDPAPEPKRRLSRDGKRRDIAFPSKAQLQRTMSGKAQPSKPVNKYKASFPSDVQAVKPKLSRTLSPRLGARSPRRSGQPQSSSPLPTEASRVRLRR